MAYYCVICRSNFCVKDAGVLHCGHGFHSSCLPQCAKRYTKCPVCRKQTRSNTYVKRLYLVEADEASSSGENSVVQRCNMEWSTFNMKKALIEEDREALAKELDAAENTLQDSIQQVELMRKSVDDFRHLQEANNKLADDGQKMAERFNEIKRDLDFEDDCDVFHIDFDVGDADEIDSLRNVIEVMQNNVKTLKANIDGFEKRLAIVNAELESYSAVPLQSETDDSGDNGPSSTLSLAQEDSVRVSVSAKHGLHILPTSVPSDESFDEAEIIDLT